MADVALGAVSLVLSFIRDEARLLRGVRGDVQFIMDEMESMNDLLRQLVQCRRRSGYYQFRPWMKQVMELAFDSKNCVELYMQSTGQITAEATPPRGSHGGNRDRENLRARLRRVPWLPWAIIARHRVVDRIRELKVRAREIGERQSRYGVVSLLPQLQATQEEGSTSRNGEAPLPSVPEPDDEPEGPLGVISWLDQESATARAELSVTAVIAEDGTYGSTIADTVYEHYKSSTTWFECVIRIAIQRPTSPDEVLLDILHGTGDTSSWEKDLEANQTALRQWLRFSLSGKKLLLVISDLDYKEIWETIKHELSLSSYSPGSAVVSFAKDSSEASICNPKKTINCSIVDVYLKKLATSLPFAHEETSNSLQVVRCILQKCSPDVDSMDLLHHALHSNPGWPEQELNRLLQELDQQRQSPTEKYKKVVAFCYETLPNQCKNCLWYSTTFFTKGRHGPNIPRARLLRRWVAQGLVTQVDGSRSAMDEAQRYFDILLAQKFLLPAEIGPAGRIKSCAVHQIVIDMIDKECPTVEDLLLNNQVPLDGLNLLFSLRDGVHLHRSKNFMESLRSLPTSSRMSLTVLDLEGREGLKMHHLRNICRMRKLKYLSLRNTDVSQLPKQMDELKFLELDIRQTRVKRLDAVLPMLKHLLAGSVHCPKEDTVRSKESFSTVFMPRAIATMDKLEILSHVKVSNSANDLINLGDKLKQLKKLGVVLSGKKNNLKSLFIQIDKLHKSLRFLSIRMEQPDYWDEIDAILLRPPKLLESLNICGIKSGLPPRIKELHQLAKITLRDTYLKEDALDILGMLQCLRCLRLRHHSFAEGALTFKGDKFNGLIVLEIEDDILARVNFASGTANKLEKMIWSFSHMESLSGITNLISLTKLELNQGTCDANGLQKLKDDIAAHCNHVGFNLKSVENGQ